MFTALGVLYNLSKEYGKAEEAFRHALSLAGQPQPVEQAGRDTGEQLQQQGGCQGLPERAQPQAQLRQGLVNMGIGFSNQGLYKESIPTT